MWAEHMCVIWSCIRIKGEVKLCKTDLSARFFLFFYFFFYWPFQSDSSKVVFFLVCASVVSYVVFVLSLLFLVSSFILLVHREGFASYIWHFLCIFIHIFNLA